MEITRLKPLLSKHPARNALAKREVPVQLGGADPNWPEALRERKGPRSKANKASGVTACLNCSTHSAVHGEGLIEDGEGSDTLDASEPVAASLATEEPEPGTQGIVTLQPVQKDQAHAR